MLEAHVKSHHQQAGPSIEILMGLAQVSSAGGESRTYTLKEKVFEAFEDIAFFCVSNSGNTLVVLHALLRKKTFT